MILLINKIILPKQKKQRNIKEFKLRLDSPDIHISGLEILDRTTGKWVPLEKKWITDLKNLTYEQKRSFKERMIQINKELTEEWKKKSKK